MMPFRNVITKNIEKLKGHDIQMIAPSNDQIYDRPAWIMDAYRDRVMGAPHNLVVLPFVSMHGSTRQLVDHLTSALVGHGVRVELFNLAVTDIGKLAMALVDAATVVLGVPTILAGPLRPKAQFLSIIGSYGWGGKTVETLAGMIPNLKVEVLDPVLCKGVPSETDFEALDHMATMISNKHKENGLK